MLMYENQFVTVHREPETGACLITNRYEAPIMITVDSRQISIPVRGQYPLPEWHALKLCAMMKRDSCLA